MKTVFSFVRGIPLLRLMVVHQIGSDRLYIISMVQNKDSEVFSLSNGAISYDSVQVIPDQLL